MVHGKFQKFEFICHLPACPALGLLIVRGRQAGILKFEIE
jgi:hypothetical protein